MPQVILPDADPNHPYYHDLAVLLEPGAIEAPKYETFTYTVGASETKYLLLAWGIYIDPNTNARYDVRVPNNPLPLRNITLKGAGGGAAILCLDPSLASYPNARDTYFDRLDTLSRLASHHVYDAGTANNNQSTFLPGPYGSILTSVQCYDYAWVGLGMNGSSGVWSIDYELGDSTTVPIRFQHTMTLPVTKASSQGIATGYPNNANARGVLTYVILPANWGVIADPLAPYIFRDDFLGTALDTGVWTRAQSTAGNVEINTDFAWLKLTGNGAWNTNGAFRTTGIARANGRVLVMDVHPTSTHAGMVVGWHDGAGHHQDDFAHGIVFGSDGTTIFIVENGTTRATLGTKYTKGQTYRVRLTLGTSGACTYEIQGGTQHPVIGSASWTNLPPGTTSSATDPLHPGASVFSGTSYVGDVRVY